MVGDYIADEHGIMQVVSVGLNHLYAIYEGDGATIVEMDNNFYPILLTDEFFEKNDFDEKILQWSEGSRMYEMYESYGYIISIGMLKPRNGPFAYIYYVHELQQLLRLGGHTELANNVKL